jgi:hypothetical protein
MSTVPGTRRSRAWLRHVLLAALLGGFALTALVSLVHRDQRAKLGEEIVYDDFGFTVIGMRRASEVGPSSSRVAARGSFVVLRMRIANHAERVEYALSQHTPILEDSSGNRFRADARATEALARDGAAPSPPASIHAGEEFISEVAFDVPRDASGLRVRITWGDATGAIDRLVRGDRTIVLDP